MTKEQAHELLDAVKAGVQASRRAITQALRATGDLRMHRPQTRSGIEEKQAAKSLERIPS